MHTCTVHSKCGTIVTIPGILSVVDFQHLLFLGFIGH